MNYSTSEELRCNERGHGGWNGYYAGKRSSVEGIQPLYRRGSLDVDSFDDIKRVQYRAQRARAAPEQLSRGSIEPVVTIKTVCIRSR